MQQALQADPPILQLDDTQLPDAHAQAAQKLAVAHPEFLKFTRDDKTGAALHNEVMNVQALPGISTVMLGRVRRRNVGGWRCTAIS